MVSMLAASIWVQVDVEQQLHACVALHTAVRAIGTASSSSSSIFGHLLLCASLAAFISSLVWNMLYLHT
jgi:hypothetical protein